MVFVEKALSMMEKGYAAVIIQSSAGSGKASEYNKRILEHSTLLASIRMPIDLFMGKSNVQTHVYVFRVGEAHQKDDVVKSSIFPTTATPAPTVRKQAKICLIRTGRKSAIRKSSILSVSAGRSSPFSRRKNTMRGISTLKRETTGIRRPPSIQRPLSRISKRR